MRLAAVDKKSKHPFPHNIWNIISQNSPSDCEPKFDFEFPEGGPNELSIERKLVLSSFGIYLIASLLTSLNVAF